MLDRTHIATYSAGAWSNVSRPAAALFSFIFEQGADMRTTSIRNGLFAAILMASFGFGSSQAVASPQRASTAGTCTPQQQLECDSRCIEEGGDGGFCDNTQPGMCYCY